MRRQGSKPDRVVSQASPSPPGALIAPPGSLPLAGCPAARVPGRGLQNSCEARRRCARLPPGLCPRLGPSPPGRSPRRRRRGGQSRLGGGCQAGPGSGESWPPAWPAPAAWEPGLVSRGHLEKKRTPGKSRFRRGQQEKRSCFYTSQPKVFTDFYKFLIFREGFCFPEPSDTCHHSSSASVKSAPLDYITC